MLPLLLAVFLGAPVQIEARGLPPEAVQKAMAEIAEVEKLTSDGIAALNAAAGKGPQPVDPRLFAALSRAHDFCVWSEGAQGPLGRDLYRLWTPQTLPADPPEPDQVEKAAGAAACDRLTLDPQKGTAALSEGSGLDLRSFAEGLAVDRAVEVLKKEGAANAFVRIGTVQRGLGPGPGGKGWPAALFQAPGQEEPPDRIYLRDRSLAIASQALFVNQRTGQPARGVLAAATVTDLAIDAQGLASAVFITGPREGQLRLGSLQPRPSVRWFLGNGEGTPLLVDYRWSEVARQK
jgi:thiamine biosynthesis lipoprotein